MRWHGCRLGQIGWGGVTCDWSVVKRIRNVPCRAKYSKPIDGLTPIHRDELFCYLNEAAVQCGVEPRRARRHLNEATVCKLFPLRKKHACCLSCDVFEPLLDGRGRWVGAWG